MQQYIWSKAAAAAFASDGELRILVLEEQDQMIAVAPLVQRKGSRCLELLAVEELFEPTDLVYSRAQDLRILADALIDLGWPLLLSRIPLDSPFPDALSRAFRGRGVFISRPNGGWPWIRLDSSWEEPESRLNAGRRSDFHRAQRRAKEFGEVRADILTPSLETLPDLLEEAFKVEAASWKGGIHSALALDPKRGAFYRHYCAAACEKGILRLCFLRVGGQTAAMQIAVESGGSFWLLKIGYDEKFARCSPGNLLLRESLRYAASRGLHSFEFLGTVEPWIRVWTDLERPCVAVRGYPWGFRGGAQLVRDVAKSGWQKLFHLRKTVTI
jgi:CelD/BcsL family acetyltransferase involved in cellulose biosynthesis